MANGKVRSIVVDNITFKYLVAKDPDTELNLEVRIYSSIYKSSFIEVFFTWEDSNLINLYRAKIVELLIRYGINKGWNYKKHNSVLKITDSTNLIKELNLKNINFSLERS